MPTFNYPRIQFKDYPVLLDLIEENFPKARHEWPARHDDWEALYIAKMREDRTHGAEINFIDISPRDFIAFCHDQGQKGDLMSIQRYVESFGEPGQVISDYDPFDTDI